MIRQMEKLPSGLLPRLPFKIARVYDFNSYHLLVDNDNIEYRLYTLTKEQYLMYLELSKSKNIEKSICEVLYNSHYYLVFTTAFHPSEELAVVKKGLPILENIFEEFSYSISLKKEHSTNLTNTYKLLDNKFSYFEIRIREIEMMPRKNDISWVILSKYYIVLDAKVYLYDLQQDIFQLIDKNQAIDYGLIFTNISHQNYKIKTVIPDFSAYYGPIGMLYARQFLFYDHLDVYSIFADKLKKLDKFNQKYFCFMCIYIYILNLNLDVLLNPYNVSNYLSLTKKITFFIKKFGDYAK